MTVRGMKMLEPVKKKKVELFAVITGVLLGVLCFVLPFYSFLKIAGVLILAIAVLWKTEIGAFLTVGLIPFLPTMHLVALVSLTLLSFIIKLFVDKNLKPKATFIDLFILIFIGVIFYSSATSFAPADSFRIALVYAAFILFYIVLVSTVKTRQQFYALVTLFILGAFVVASFGLYQNYAGYYEGEPTVQSWTDEEMFKDIRLRVTSTFDNPNVLGEYLVLVIPLCLSMLWVRKNWLNRVIFACMAFVMLICLIFTWSRGAWLGLIFASSVFILLRDRRFVLLGAAGIFALPFVLSPAIISRFASIGNLQDSSSAYRFSIWIGSLDMIKDYWPSGIGLGAKAFTMVYPKYALSGASYALHAHNIYLQLLVEMGIVGLVVFVLLVFGFYKLILSACYKTSDNFLFTFMAALCAGMSGYLLQGMVDNIWYNYRIFFTFWTMFSFGLIARRLVDKEVKGTGQDEV